MLLMMDPSAWASNVASLRIGPRTDKVETTQPTHALVILADDAKRKKTLRLSARTEGIFPSTGGAEAETFYPVRVSVDYLPSW